MRHFDFNCPTKVLFGSGRLAEAGQAAKSLGKKPLVLIGSGSVRKSGVLDRVLGLLKASGLAPVLFEKVEPNPRCSTLDKAAALGLEKGCGLVIGLGGGSVMDGAKGVAAAMGENGRAGVWDFTRGTGSKRLDPVHALPIMMITTLAATGSEGNGTGIISNWETHEKAAIYGIELFPRISIVDPELTLTLSKEQTRYGAFDIMTHVLETYMSGDDKASSQDRISEGIVVSAMDCLALLEKDPKDITARENLSWTSVAALLGEGPNLGRTGAFPVHAMEHALSAHTDVAHGKGLALLWPRYMRMMAPKRKDKIRRLGRALFCVTEKDEDAAVSKTLDTWDAWQKQAQLWFKFNDVAGAAGGLPANEMFEKMADHTIRIDGGGKDFVVAALPLKHERIVELFRMTL